VNRSTAPTSILIDAACRNDDRVVAEHRLVLRLQILKPVGGPEKL
jgi:hypothetical protein